MTPYEAGRQARREGKSEFSNPYDKHACDHYVYGMQMERSCWHDGWKFEDTQARARRATSEMEEGK